MASIHPIPHEPVGVGYRSTPSEAVRAQGHHSSASAQPATTDEDLLSNDGNTALVQGTVTIKQKSTRDTSYHIETGRWSAGLCDCCNNCMPNLFMTWCCPCVALAQVYARVAVGRYRLTVAWLFILVVVSLSVRSIVPTSGDDYYTGRWDANGNFIIERTGGANFAFTVGLASYVALYIAFVFHVVYVRRRIRRRFQIPGNCCGDCLVSWCCSCCAVAQMATHVKSYKPGDCSFGPPDVLPAYD